jgi:hypothetical protein
MAWAEGSWGAFVAPFLSHTERHFTRLIGNVGGLAELGLVKGVGGVVPATILALLAVVGAVVWARRVGRQEAGLWALVLTVAVVQLVWIQNREYSRYAVAVHMAMAPLLAGAAAALPRVAGCAGLLALAVWLGVSSYPLVAEQHSTRLGLWQAIQWGEEEAAVSGRTVVVESEIHPFAAYWWNVQYRRRGAVPPVVPPWDLEPLSGSDSSWLVVTASRRDFPDSLFGRERRWTSASEALRSFTKRPFLEAWAIEDCPLPVAGWWPAEQLPSGRRFMWGAADAELLLPPLPVGARLGFALRPAPGPAPLVVEYGGREVAHLDGEAGEHRVWLDITPEIAGVASRLRFGRVQGYPPGGEDRRPLAVQLYEVRALGPTLAWQGKVVFGWQRQALHVELDGEYQPEDFGPAGQAVWLRPRARLTVPAAAGRLGLRLWAPRPTPAGTVVMIGERQAGGPFDIGLEPGDFEVEVRPDEVEEGMVELEVVSAPFVPAEHGSDDQRDLGVVLSDLWFRPAP